MYQPGQILSSFETHMNVGMDGAKVIVRLPASGSSRLYYYTFVQTTQVRSVSLGRGFIESAFTLTSTHK